MTVLYINAPFQTTFTIRTNCEKLVFMLCLKYGKYINKSNDKADFTISINKIKDLFEIRTPQKIYTTDYPLQEIDDIIFENTRYNNSIIALHGAAVGYNGRAYMFLAATASGKTTLASYLSSRCFRYITDDCILLDRESFTIYPYNTPIHLRDGGVEVLKKYGAVPKGLELLDDISIKRHIYSPKNCVENELALAEIFFIKRTPDINQLVEMSINERVSELLKSPITNYTVTAEHIRLFSRLAKLSCRRLLYSDMDYVCEVVRSG